MSFDPNSSSNSHGLNWNPFTLRLLPFLYSPLPNSSLHHLVISLSGGGVAWEGGGMVDSSTAHLRKAAA